MKMQFIYESQAFFAGFHRGKGFPLEGMERMANIAHKYKIPVTWLTNAKGAESASEKFTEYHKQYGDDVSLWLMPYAEYKKEQYKIVTHWTKDDIRAFVQNELDQAKQALPWAKWDTCGFFFRTNDVVQVLAEMGFIAVYGACWYQFNTDSVDDVGIPYGSYYMDPQFFKRPAPNAISLTNKNQPQPLISNEWLTHDLNKVSNYKRTASIFSTDPNDVNNNGICYPGENQYWYELFRQYYRNSLYNEFYPFIFHQESHEMLNTPQFQLYAQKQVEESAAILDDLLAFVTEPSNHFDIEFTTIPTAMRKYREQFSITPSMISLFDDIEIATERFQTRRVQELNKHEWKAKKIAKTQGANHTKGLIGGPFPPTLIYYDTDCQLFFHKGQSWPIEIRNYHKMEQNTIKNISRNSDIFRETRFPLPIWTMPNPQEINISIGSKPQGLGIFPYGLVLWDPERLFNGKLYLQWKQMIDRINHSDVNHPIEQHTESIRKILNIEGPVENIRFCWYWDQHPSQIGGCNAILLRFNLTDNITTIKINPR